MREARVGGRTCAAVQLAPFWLVALGGLVVLVDQRVLVEHLECGADVGKRVVVRLLALLLLVNEPLHL